MYESVARLPLRATLTTDGDQTVLVWEERGMLLDQLAAYGAGIQVHVEDLAIYFADTKGGGRDGTGRMDTQKQGAFAALAVPDFHRYVTGQSFSLIGTWVETVAQALLALHLTHSGTVLA
jgi:hypothetical protein